MFWDSVLLDNKTNIITYFKIKGLVSEEILFLESEKGSNRPWTR